MAPNAFFVSFAKSFAASKTEPATARRVASNASASAMGEICAPANARATAVSNRGCNLRAASSSRPPTPSPFGPTAGHRASTARSFATLASEFSPRRSAHAARNRRRSTSGGGRPFARPSAWHATLPCGMPLQAHVSPPHSFASPQVAHVNRGAPSGAVNARHRAHAESRNATEVPHTMARSRSTHSPAAMSRVATSPTPRPGISRGATAGAYVEDIAAVVAPGARDCVGGRRCANVDRAKRKCPVDLVKRPLTWQLSFANEKGREDEPPRTASSAPARDHAHFSRVDREHVRRSRDFGSRDRGRRDASRVTRRDVHFRSMRPARSASSSTSRGARSRRPRTRVVSPAPRDRRRRRRHRRRVVRRA